MKFVFIGGCGRSGSSLLQDLLYRHPEIAGGPEFNFTARILQLHGNMQKPFYLKRNDLNAIAETLEEVQSTFRLWLHGYHTCPNLHERLDTIPIIRTDVIYEVSF